jgi:hypothetical protein
MDIVEEINTRIPEINYRKERYDPYNIQDKIKTKIIKTEKDLEM